VKLFGLIEINWAKKEPPLDKDTTVADVFQALQAMGRIAAPEPGQHRRVRTIGRARITDQIVFPEPNDHNDVWEVQRLTNLVQNVDKMFTRGWIDICELDKAVTEFKLCQPPRAKAAYEKLRLLHCVSFNKYLPGIFEQVPDLMTCVFSEGRLPAQPVSDSLRITQE